MTPLQDKTKRCGFLITYTPTEFKELCQMHDVQYELKHAGIQSLTRSEVDRQFYQQMLIKAGNSIRLKITAHIFYGLTKLFGGIIWNRKV